VLENIKDLVVLKQVLSHLEHTYKRFPPHLQNKVLLYSKLYEYYMANR
jgi:hypothetical protein